MEITGIDVRIVVNPSAATEDPGEPETERARTDPPSKPEDCFKNYMPYPLKR